MSTATASVMAGDWVSTLGKTHGARDRAALLAASAARDGSAAMEKLSLDRWTPIVAAMTRLVSAYNASFEREVLSLVDDRAEPSRPVVTIQSADEGSPSLVAALEGTLICVRSRDAQGQSGHAERPVRADRNDDQTAAYVLQPWMERL